MQAQYQASRINLTAVRLALLAVVLVILALAGGYVIRLATAQTSTSQTPVVVSAHGGDAGVPAGSCVWLDSQKAC